MQSFALASSQLNWICIDFAKAEGISHGNFDLGYPTIARGVAPGQQSGSCWGARWSWVRGGIIIKKTDISDFFEFQTYLKNADPPFRSNFRHFLIWEHIDDGRPPGLTS